MSKVIIIIAFCAVFLGAYVLIIGPRLELTRRHQINTRMTVLRDRAKADPPDTNALDLMIRALRSSDSFERTAATAYLGEVGSRAEPAVDALAEVLKGGDLYAAREAARSLGEIGPGAKRAIPALTNAVQQHPHADIGWFAAQSLGHIADPDDASVSAVLEQAAKSSDDLMVHDATAAIRTLEARRKKHEQPGDTGNKLR